MTICDGLHSLSKAFVLCSPWENFNSLPLLYGLQCLVLEKQTPSTLWKPGLAIGLFHQWNVRRCLINQDCKMQEPSSFSFSSLTLSAPPPDCTKCRDTPAAWAPEGEDTWSGAGQTSSSHSQVIGKDPYCE